MRYLTLNLIFFFTLISYGQEPTVPASNIVFNSTGCNEVDLSWTNGNGTGRVVFIIENSSFSDVPQIGEFYTDIPIYGKGEDIKYDKKHFCIYRGSGSSVKVKGLKSLTKYCVAVFEYVDINEYKTDVYPTACITTKNIVADFSLFPGSQCLHGNNTSFNNTSYCDLGPLSFTWLFDDGDSSDVKNPSHVYKRIGQMYVKLIAKAPGCYASFKLGDTINGHPVVRFFLEKLPYNDSIQCLYSNRYAFGNKTTLIDEIGGPPPSIRYQWWCNNDPTYFSDGYKASIHFTTPGTKKVKLIATSSHGCSDSATITYKISPSVIAPSKVSVSPKSMILTNNQFTFINTNPNSVTHKWVLLNKYDKNFKDTTFGANVKYSFKGGGWYYVILETKDANGECIDRLKDSVHVEHSSSIYNKIFQTISIYPNPSKSGIFNITNLPANASIKVYSIIGQELVNLNPEKTNSEINLERFGAGTYILSVWSEGRKFDYRLVVL